MIRILLLVSTLSVLLLSVTSFSVLRDERIPGMDIAGERPTKWWEILEARSLKPGISTFLEKPQGATTAQIARFIVNQADWGAIASISANEPTSGYPYAAVTSVSDGPLGNGSGIPYMTFSSLSTTNKNAKKDPRVTLLMSLVQGDYCAEHNLDPIDPRCSRINLTGKLVKIDKQDEEYAIAKEAFYGRHPSLNFKPMLHGFYLAKIDIEDIALLDGFGGAKHVSVKDYLEACD